MYITLNSEFKPFTYDELVKPLQDYKEAYDKVEEQYSTLAQQTEAWKNIATQENSPEAYAMYKKYSDELNAVVEDFSKGMTASNRGKLLGLKTRYASEIGTIEQAHKAYNDMINFRNNNTDKSAIYLKNYSSMDDFLGGKIADNNYISGDQVQKDITAKVLAQAYSDYSNLVNAGVKPEKAIQQIMDTNSKNITNIVNTENSSLGRDNFDEIGRAKLDNAITSGVIQGLGSFASKEYMSKAERDASTRGWANVDLSIKAHEDTMKSNGYKKDSKGNWVVDTSSPRWVASGVTFTEDGTAKGKSIEKTKKPELSEDLIITTNDKGEVQLQDKSTKSVYNNYKKYSAQTQEIKNKITAIYKDMTPADLDGYLFGTDSVGNIAVKKIETTTVKKDTTSGADNVVIKK